MGKRRTRGDGGLYQRHDHASCPPLVDGVRAEHRCQGRWVGNIEIWVDGRKVRKSVYAPTQKAARIKLARLNEAKRTGTVVASSMTVEKWLDYWLTHIAARDVRPQTLAGYQSKVETLMVPYLGKHRLTSLRPEHLRAWHDDLRRGGSRHGGPLAEASVRQAHLILRKALRDAVYDGKLVVNPADRVKPPKTATTQREAFTVDQAAAILTKAGPDARWWLAVFYGLRQGEVLGLRWCDVDFTASTIRIEQTLQIGVDRTVLFGPPKTARSRRTMPMLDPITARLLLHQPAGVSPTSLVFNAGGQPIKPWNDSRAWHQLLDDAGVPHLPLHSARHTAASVLEAAGVPDRLIMQILGHSQVQTTHGYTHAELGRQADALTSALEVLAIE